MLFYISDFTYNAYNIYSLSVSIVYKIHNYLYSLIFRKCNQWGSYIIR